jgi:hypothetical protein
MHLFELANRSGLVGMPAMLAATDSWLRHKLVMGHHFMPHSGS